jgi:hypothetical protein
MRKTRYLASFRKINDKYQLLNEKGDELVPKFDAMPTEGTEGTEAGEEPFSPGRLSLECGTCSLSALCVHILACVHRSTGEKAVAVAGWMRKTFNMIMITISSVNVRDEIDFH